MGFHRREPLFRDARLRRCHHRHGRFRLHGVGSRGDGAPVYLVRLPGSSPRIGAFMDIWWTMAACAILPGAGAVEYRAIRRYGRAGAGPAPPSGVVRIMLDIETFDNSRGGNMVYKALAHPLRRARLAGWQAAGRWRCSTLTASPGRCWPCALILTWRGLYVQDVQAVGSVRGGHVGARAHRTAAGWACKAFWSRPSMPGAWPTA